MKTAPFSVAGLVALMLALSACNTIQGVGRATLPAPAKCSRTLPASYPLHAIWEPNRFSGVIDP